MGSGARLGSCMVVCMHLSQLRSKVYLTDHGSVWGGSNLSVLLCTGDIQAEASHGSLTGVPEGSASRWGSGQPPDLWKDAAQWGNLGKCRSPGEHLAGLEGVARVLQAGSRGGRNAPRLQGCIGSLTKTPEFAHCLSSLQLLQHILPGLCAGSAVNIGHGLPHGEETEVQYIIGENIRGEEQENLTFMSPGRGNR